MVIIWNEYNLKALTSINWRASLVPAAAVIPAPIAYTNVVAVKKLVVELLSHVHGRHTCGPSLWLIFVVEPWRRKSPWGSASFTVKKLECSRQALARIH